MIIEKFNVEKSKIESYIKNTLKLNYVFFDSVKGYNRFKKVITLYKNEMSVYNNLCLVIKLNKKVYYKIFVDEIEFNKAEPPKVNDWIHIRVEDLLDLNQLEYNNTVNKIEITSEMIDEEIRKSEERWREKFTKEEKSYFVEMGIAIGDLLDYKNKNYGNSALEPLNIFTGKCKVGQRLDDKLARIKNSDTVRTNDVVDTIGYLILLLKEKNVRPEQIQDFKD